MDWLVRNLATLGFIGKKLPAPGTFGSFLGTIFFLIVTPTGLLLRLFGKDVINLKYNNNNSYWIEKTGPKSNMKDQF